MRALRLWIGVFALASQLIVATAWAFTYAVRRGDTLSTIVDQCLQTRIYGKRGGLARLLSLNPRINDPDKIVPGQLVDLGDGQIIALKAPTELATDLSCPPLDPAHRELASVSEAAPPAPAPAPDDSQELILSLRVAYGASIIGFKQTGAFADVNAFAIALNNITVEACVEHGDVFAMTEFATKSLILNTDTANSTAPKETKNFETLALKGGYRFVYAGVEGTTSPVFKPGSGTGLLWGDITSLSAVLGARHQINGLAPSGKRFGLWASLEAQLPVAAGSTTADLRVSQVSGYGAKLRLGAKKALLPSTANTQVYLGLQGIAAYSHVKYNGVWGSASGNVEKTLQEYHSLLIFEVGL